MLGLVCIKDDWSMQDNKGSDTLQQSVISKSFNSNDKYLEEKNSAGAVEIYLRLYPV